MSREELKYGCLQLACDLAKASVIPGVDIVKKAEEFFVFAANASILASMQWNPADSSDATSA
jgi:hypothetical protein